MKKQTTRCWQSLLLATIAIFIVLGASGSISAQKADKYPKPDFSAMEEYFEIVEWEYDFTSGVPTFNVIAKPKQKVVPRYWEITWRDAKGIILTKYTIMFNSVALERVKIGEPVRGSSYAPWKETMAKIKSVIVTEDPTSPEGRTAN